MKTSELTGVALNWAVAKCEGLDYWYPEIGPSQPEYSTDWAQGGPIIEHDGITVEYLHDSRWLARHPIAKRNSNTIYGAGYTPLVAAMRCYVASKLGDEVEVPQELV